MVRLAGDRAGCGEPSLSLPRQSSKFMFSFLRSDPCGALGIQGKAVRAQLACQPQNRWHQGGVRPPAGDGVRGDGRIANGADSDRAREAAWRSDRWYYGAWPLCRCSLPTATSDAVEKSGMFA